MRVKILVIVIFSSFLQCKGSFSFLTENAPIRSIDMEIGPSITCIVRGSIPNPIITWFLGDQELGKDEYENTHDEKTLVSVSTLQKPITDFDKRSVLTCAGLNPEMGEKVFASRIAEYEAQPIGFMEIETKPAIKCTVAFSVPKPIIFWYIGDEIIGADQYETTHNEQSLVSVSTLKMNPTDIDKAKFLTCVALNPIKGEKVYRSIKYSYIHSTDNFLPTDDEDFAVLCHGRGSIDPVIVLERGPDALEIAGYHYVYRTEFQSDWELSLLDNDTTKVLMCRFLSPKQKDKFIFLVTLYEPAPISESERNLAIEVHAVGITEGSPLLCTVAGSRPQPDIVWYVDGEEVPRTIYSYNYEEKKLLAKSALDIKGMSANVTCIARNPYFPEKVKSATIAGRNLTESQFALPKIYQNPLRCMVGGLNPQTNITWFVGDEQISEENIKTQYDFKSSTQISILKVPLQSILGKTAECNAKHPHIPDYIKATVLQPAPVSDPISDVSKVNIDSNPVRCEAIGSKPEPVFTWFLDNEMVPRDKHSQIYKPNTLTTISHLDILLPTGKLVSVACIATNPIINLPVWNHTYMYFHSSRVTQLFYGEGKDYMNKIGKLGLLYNDFTGQNTGKYKKDDDAPVVFPPPKNKDEAFKQINKNFEALEKQGAYLLEFLDKHLKAQNKFSSESAIVIKQLFSLEKDIIDIGEENGKKNIHREEILAQLFSFGEDMVSLAAISETFLKPYLNNLNRSVNDLYKPVKEVKNEIFKVGNTSPDIQSNIDGLIGTIESFYTLFQRYINKCFSKPITVYKDIFSNVQYALTKYLDHVTDLADQVKEHKNFLKLYSDHYGTLFAGERANEDRLHYTFVILKVKKQATDCIYEAIDLVDKIVQSLLPEIKEYFTQ